MDRPVPRNSVSVGGLLKSQPVVMPCSICGQPVSLEAAKADEYGRTIHEECYALKMRLKEATTPPAA